jgi:hypothetical protein
MEVVDGLWNTGEFIYIYDAANIVFEGCLKMIVYSGHCWYMIPVVGGLLTTFGVTDESAHCSLM